MTIDKKDGGLPPRENPSLDMPAGAGFASLGGLGAAIDGEAAAALNPDMSGAAPGAPADMGPDYMRGASGLVDLVSAALDGFAPGAGWPEQQRGVMAASIAPVLEKYNWDVIGQCPPEVGAALVCGPALYFSYKVVMAKLKADRFALENARPGMKDPNTIMGAAAAESGPPAGSPGIGEVSGADALAAAAASLPQFPDM
jgi:hypothetical protein